MKGVFICEGGLALCPHNASNEKNPFNSTKIDGDFGYFSIIPAQAIESPVMMHTFMVTFCFHIEFHRKVTEINL